MKTRTECDRNRRLLLSGLLLAPALPAVAAAEAMQGDMHAHHHHHHDAAASDAVTRREGLYQIPAVQLVRQDGVAVALPKELDDGRPVLLNFIYTSCTAICPVTSQIFSTVQSRLDADNQKPNMVSISIDPEYDTPQRLAEYAKRFGAGEHWHFYTGTQAASVAVQKAFDVYRGDKMNHTPVTFLRAAPGKPWVRLEGFPSPAALVREYQALVKGA